MATRRKALGRGLSSLIPEPPTAAAPVASRSPYVEIDLDLVDPNPSQPRHRFPDGDLEELAASIAVHGVVQPVLVRRRGERYQLVAGERRLRAAQRAGLRKIPAVLREVPDDRMREVALVENIQREELDPIDEALAYRALLDEHGRTQVELAEQVGKDPSTISNSLRLLGLSENLQLLVRERALTPGHARVLLAVPEGKEREALARRIIRQALSVRQAEKLTGGRKRPDPVARATEAEADANTRDAEERLMRALGTRVRIRRSGEAGTVEIAFHGEEELQRIFEHIMEGA